MNTKSTDYTIELSNFAEDDLKSSIEFYRIKDNNLANEFMFQIDKVFDKVAQSPYIYSPVHRNVRKAHLAKFPFVIYFRIENFRIEVLAIFHTSRSPSTLSKRSIPREIFEE